MKIKRKFRKKSEKKDKDDAAAPLKKVRSKTSKDKADLKKVKSKISYETSKDLEEKRSKTSKVPSIKQITT